jgi:hypothetical protein
MNIGMLWFDNDPKADLSLKLQRAVSYYQQKYGKSPNLCFVHPSMLPQPAEPDNEIIKSNGIEVRINRSVLPNHLWLGIHSLSA